MSYLTTVTGSYPRKEVQKDTLRKTTVSEEDSFEMIKWAVKEQSELGLDIITDGEGYRENMYWFYQLRLDGIDAINKKHKDIKGFDPLINIEISKKKKLVTSVNDLYKFDIFIVLTNHTKLSSILKKLRNKTIFYPI